MDDRATLKAELTRDEGKRLTSYRDSRGFWTIGIGHLLGEQQRMLTITEEECDALFQADLNEAYNVAHALAPEVFAISNYEFRDKKERVLVNMAFNLGYAGLAKFKKFLAAVEVARWDDAADEMMDSLWAKQVPARAKRLRDLLLED
jgi:lysozyme